MRDMDTVYVQQNFSRRSAKWRYLELYPNRRQPNFKLTPDIYRRLETKVNILGRPKISTTEQEEDVLVRVGGTPEISTRRLETATVSSKFSVHRIVQQENLHPCHFTPVQNLLENDFARAVNNYLNQHFTNRWISRGSSWAWPARSPDFNPLDFCSKFNCLSKIDFELYDLLLETSTAAELESDIEGCDVYTKKFTTLRLKCNKLLESGALTGSSDNRADGRSTSFKIAQAQDVPLQSQKNSLSRANHNMLTDIFQKIGNKENTKDGLNLLYDFIQQHPEADIEPFLSKSSKFFQEYIQTGLKEIDSIRRIAKHSNS
ncbi:hypothetical protein YQE_10316, partial [Dendroctonus ponderosae]